MDFAGDHPFEGETFVASFFVLVEDSVLVDSEFFICPLGYLLEFFVGLSQFRISFVLGFVSGVLDLSSDLVGQEVIGVSLSGAFVEFSLFHEDFSVRKFFSYLDILPLFLFGDLFFQDGWSEQEIGCQ